MLKTIDIMEEEFENLIQNHPKKRFKSLNPPEESLRSISALSLTPNSDYFGKYALKVRSKLELNKTRLPFSQQVEDLTKRYQSQAMQKQKNLEAIEKITRNNESTSQSTKKFQRETSDRQSALKYEIAKLREEEASKTRELEKAIQKYEQTINFFKTLSGIQVEEDGTVGVHWQGHSVYLRLEEVDGSFDCDLLKSTVPEDRIDKVLLSGLNTLKSDLPLLLSKVFKSLF